MRWCDDNGEGLCPSSKAGLNNRWCLPHAPHPTRLPLLALGNLPSPHPSRKRGQPSLGLVKADLEAFQLLGVLLGCPKEGGSVSSI